jgi:hypothetical protein
MCSVVLFYDEGLGVAVVHGFALVPVLLRAAANTQQTGAI